MVYLTGDTHGDIERFRKGKLRWLSKKDTVIILGDFGFLWDDSKKEKEYLAWLKKRKYTILFLDGTHENFDLLEQYPVAEHCGAKVRHLGGNLYYACRGSIFDIEGKKLLCFGGGQSPDQEDRVAGQNWWAQEMPSKDDFEACANSLAAHDYRVDYILTHEAPSRLLNFTDLQTDEKNELHGFFDKIMVEVDYQKWYVGRYHRDVVLSSKAECVFLKVIALK